MRPPPRRICAAPATFVLAFSSLLLVTADSNDNSESIGLCLSLRLRLRRYLSFAFHRILLSRGLAFNGCACRCITCLRVHLPGHLQLSLAPSASKFYFPLPILESDATSNTRPNGKELMEIVVSQDPRGIEAGSTPHLLCKTFEPASNIWWTYDNKNLTSVKENDFVQRFDLKKATRQDSGNYTCNVQISSNIVKKTIRIRVIGKYFYFYNHLSSPWPIIYLLPYL
jgi:hypothetical protein